MTKSQPGPLAGVRILEIGHMLAGPYCGMLLADLGADVIKIEPPTGDISRTVGALEVDGHNAYFASLNRNKRSVILDLATPSGQRALHKLARSAQGLVTNLRPSAITKLGLTYEALAATNPKLACLALTGYGLTGPFAENPAYDYVIQALAGVMAMTGEPGGPPVKAGYSVVDNSAGIMAALGLVSMIYKGEGGQIDVSLYDTLLSQLNYLASAYLNGGEKPQRYPGGGHSYFVPAQIFATADGHLALFITHDSFWRKFAEEAGPAHWLTDPRFMSAAARSLNRQIVVDEVAALLANGSTADWVNRLAPLGIVVAGVETLDRALDGALTASRQMVVSVMTPGGKLRLVGSPIKISDYTPDLRVPPRLGEHNAGLVDDEEPANGHRQ